MSDTEIIKQLIEDRKNLEDSEDRLSEALEMCLNLIEKGPDKSNYSKTDVIYTSKDALEKCTRA